VVAVDTLSPFHAVLERRREQYNARFRLARHRTGSLDPQEFLAYLRDVIGPVVDASASAEPVCDALVELSLELASRGRLGGEFARLLPAVAPLLATDPRRLPMALANAVHHLESSGSAAGWVDTMTELTGHTTSADSLLAAGAVAAWRHGLAQLRTAALATAATVPAPLLGIALGTTSTVDLARLATDPWSSPGAVSAPALLPVRRVGAFRGFGGAFRRPPTVSTSDGRWYASDGVDTWRVFADRFGVNLGRIAAVPAGTHQTGQLMLSRGGHVLDTETGLTVDLPELADVTSWASAGGTLAATTPWTHGILFVARTTG
jgi:hypothetical protein